MQRLVPCFIVLIALIVALPSQLAAQPAACLAAADLVGTLGFEESPRDDRTAEMLALWYADGLAADATLFERLHADLENFALLHPGVELWDVSRDHADDRVMVRFVSQAAQLEAQAGDNDAFNCLLELLDSDHSFFFASVLAVVGFDGRYDIPRVAELFELIPEVQSSNPAFINPGLETGCFHSPDGRRRTIFLEEIIYLFPAIFLGEVIRIDVDPTAGITYEQYDTREDAPWQDEYEACLDHQLSGDLDPDILGVVDIPTLPELGLLVLVLSLMAAGIVRTRFA